MQGDRVLNSLCLWERLKSYTRILILQLRFFFTAFLTFFTAFFTAVAALARRFFLRACRSFAPGSAS
jgi:hypothetical protein